MKHSETLSNLAGALARVQAAIKPAKFNAKNPFLKNNYADLGSVIEASAALLGENGLSIAQFPVSDQGRVGVTSILMHESGEWLEETITLVPDTAKGLSANQAAGVTITYLKRYARVSILGMFAEEDVDGDVQAGATVENAEANDNIKNQMAVRTWSNEQTEVLSRIALDAGLEPLNYEDASEILNWSSLPANAPTKTVDSWFKHFVKSTGASVALKAADANDAYIKAKKAK